MNVKVVPARFQGEQITCFRGSDVAPKIKQNGRGQYIEGYEGEGMSRSWGRAFVGSHVVLKTKTFAAIVIGYSHKHGGGQGWFYFERKDGQVKRLKANQLSVRRRKQVLDAYSGLPGSFGWIKRPISEV